MGTLTNYSEFLQAAKDLCEDDSDEFNAYLPNALKIAEGRLFHYLDIDWSGLSTTLTVGGTNTLAKPTGYRVGHNLYISVNGAKQRLIKKTEDFIYDYWPDASTTGVPKYYADRDESVFILAPTPDTTYTVTFEYESKPAGLSESVPTNIFTDKYPEALFSALVSECARYLHYPEMSASYDADFMGLLNAANSEGKRARTDDATNVANAAPGRNIKG